MVDNPWDYEWSSCRYYVGVNPVPDWLCCEFILDFFSPAENKFGMYRKYLSVSIDSSVRLDTSQDLSKTFLGRRKFVETICDERLKNIKHSRDIPDPDKFKSKINVKAVFDVVAETGVKNVIQPGGSIRDDEVIQACDEKGISMVFTGVRHFKH